jgi:DNA uptake protein ComE-like DNA-binding protein
MFCDVFDHNTRFDRLIELCRTFQVDIKIEGEQYKLSQGVNYSVVSNNTDKSNTIKIDTLAPSSSNTEKKEKLDINNASEVEITSLPGISIVLSKKIIKKREEIGGFKDVNEFLEFTQLKPHMRTQLRDLVCVNKMKGSEKIKRNSERSVDL